MKNLGKDEPLPWERQPGETAKAFAAFCVYRDLPPERRSVRLAWETSTGRKAPRTSKGPRAGSVWYHWGEDNAWVFRAGAWDSELDRRATDEITRMAVKAKLQRLKEARWLHTQGYELLQQAAARGEDIPAAVMLRMLEAGQNAERLELGDATERTEVSAVERDAQAERVEAAKEILRQLFPLAEEGMQIETGAPVDA